MSRFSVLVALLAAAPAAAAAPPFQPNALFVADVAAGAVHRLAPDCSIAATWDGAGQLTGATDLRFGPNGNLYVSCGNRIVEVNEDDGVANVIGVGQGLAGIDSFEFGPDGHLFVSCATQDRVVELDASGSIVRTFGVPGEIDDPRGIAIGSTGNLFVASFTAHRIYEFAPSGELVREFGAGSGIVNPCRLAFGPLGRLYVVSTGTGRIVAFDGADAVSNFGTDASLSGDLALVFGPDSRMYVAETTTGDLFSFGSDLVLDSIWNATPTTPRGISFAPYRFSARLEGTLSMPGATKVKTKETIEVTLNPGSGWLAFRFGAGGSKSLAAATDGAPIICHGFVVAGDDGAKFRAIEGCQVSAPAPQRGTASAALRVRGKLDSTGKFVAKEIEGTLHRAAGGFVFSGEITTLGPAD